jgi:hypothetical protein
MLLWTAELLPHPVEHWTLEGDWHATEVRQYVDGGDRVAVLLTADVGAEVWVEARAVDETGYAGPWLPADESWWGGDAQRVLTVDLPEWSTGAQVRVQGATEAVSWGLHVVEPRGDAPAGTPDGHVPPPSLSAALTAIGVVSREDWGADDTECTTTEDDWYRFAIHHTAGNQTSGGTVQGAVQALQAYSFNTGTYCDIPYQFLVGYDGSLWEGRPLTFYSGATGGGNNDGNIAVSYLGCYDSDGCGDGGDELPLVMHAAARLLVQTLATEHGITTTSDTLRGHRDWPNNATACPGDRVHDRIEELMSTSAHYQATLVETSWGGGTATVPLGQTVEGWVRLRNDGIYTWDSATMVAPLPRDVASPLADESWAAETRIAATGTTAPGETVEVPVSLYGAELGESTLELALVQEWVTWFADAPIGGGPAEGAMSLSVSVVIPDTGSPDTDTDGTDTGGPGADPSFIGPPGEAVALSRGCATSPAPPRLLLLAGALLLLRRRRLTASPYASSGRR